MEKGGEIVKKILFFGLALGAAYVTYAQLPQIRRYIKIERM
jgi:hypothetical protein